MQEWNRLHLYVWLKNLSVGGYSSLLLRGLPLDFLVSPRAFCRYDSRTGIYQKVVLHSTCAWSKGSQTNEQDTMVSFEGAQ